MATQFLWPSASQHGRIGLSPDLPVTFGHAIDAAHLFTDV
jgi:hypothetical protein